MLIKQTLNNQLNNQLKRVNNMKTRNDNIKKSFNDFNLALINLESLEKSVLIESDNLQNDFEYYKNKDKERSDKSMYSLERDLESEIANCFDEIVESDYSFYQDRLTELADNYIPIYNHDLACYLANDFSLAYVEDEGLIEGCTDIFKIIQMSIYERLSCIAYEKFEELKGEKIAELTEMQDRLIDKIDLLNDEDEDKLEQLGEQQCKNDDLIDKLENL